MLALVDRAMIASIEKSPRYYEKFMTRRNLRLLPTSVIAKHSANSERWVNYGCNLKWKLGDRESHLFSTTAAFRSKRTSNPSV
jgi:hypothetical protein